MATHAPKPVGIFHAYDVRGVYPREIDERKVARIARAAAAITKAKAAVIGHDARLSSPALFEAARRSLIAAGVDVIDIGISSTDLFYFSVEHFRSPLGLMITASHNPMQYNGIKIVGRHAIPISWNTGLARIAASATGASRPASLVVSKAVSQSASRRRSGKVITQDAVKEFTLFCRGFVPRGSLAKGLRLWQRRKGRPLRVVLDAGDGLATLLAPPILVGYGLDPVLLFFDVDGSFPGQGPDPLDVARQGPLKRAIRQHRADLGVSWDADTDRVVFFDERGTFIPPDIILSLVASMLLSRPRDFPAFSGKTVVCDVVSGRYLEREVKRCGGVLVRTPVGQASIKPAMLRHAGLIGGERSGHMTFRDTKRAGFCTDNGYIPILLVLMAMAKAQAPLSRLVAGSRSYHRSPEINIRFKDDAARTQAVFAIAEHYRRVPDVTFSTVDGVTVEHAAWWFNVRPSNTEPLLRVHAEAGTQKELAKLVRGIGRALKGSKGVKGGKGGNRDKGGHRA